MNNKLFYWLILIFFLVGFSQFHFMIPGLRYLKLGLISGKLGIVLALLNFKNLNFKQPIIRYFVLFSLAVLFSAFTAYSTSFAINTFLNLFELFCLYFVGWSVSIYKFQLLRLFIKIIILTGICLGLYTFANSGHGPGILTDENDIGMVLIILLPFAFFMNNSLNSGLWRILSFISFGIILAGIATTLSRGAMVGTLPTLFLIWMRSKKKVLALVLLGVVSLIVILNAPAKLVNEFESIGDTNGGTAGERRYYWELSIEMFKRKPIMGVGPGCWGNAIWSGLIIPPKPVHNSTPHSIYFQLLSEMGAVGTFLWGSLVVSVFLTGSKIKKMLKPFNSDFEVQADQIGFKDFITNFNTALMVGILGGLIAGAFLSLLFYPHLYACFALVHLEYVLVQNAMYNPVFIKMYSPEYSEEIGSSTVT